MQFRSHVTALAVAASLIATGADAANAKPDKSARDKPEAILAKIQAKWGKDSPAAKGAQQVLAEPQATARWLDTPIGPVAVLEGAGLLIVTPAGKPHWWIGDPAAEKSKIGEGESVAGDGEELLVLAKPDAARARFDAAPPWKFMPVSPVAGKKDRIDLVFQFEWPLDGIDGLELVPVTRDAVLWQEKAKGGYSLINLDGDGIADRVRRERKNFAECIKNICDASWFEVDRGDGKGDYGPAPAKVTQPVYRKLATQVRTQLEKLVAAPNCNALRDQSFVLYRYALLGGMDVKEARAILAKLRTNPKLTQCGTCQELGVAETREDRRDAEACHAGKQVLECLDKAEPLTPLAFEQCQKL